MKYKWIIKAMYVFCTVILVCPNLVMAQTKTRRTSPGTAIFVMAEVSPIEVESKHLSYAHQQTKLEIQVPKLSIESNHPDVKSLNKVLLTNAKKRMEQMIYESKVIRKDLEKDQIQHMPYEYNESFRIIPTIMPYYTIQFFKYQYTGGAHGISEVDYLTWHTITGQVVYLNDLFKENIDYISLINHFINSDIKKRELQGEIFFKGGEGFQGIKATQSFYINAYEELVIVFNPYEIAPYSEGIIYFSIPLKGLYPYMK